MKRRRFARLALLLMLAGAAGSALAYWENLDPAALEAQVRSYGLWAPVRRETGELQPARDRIITREQAMMDDMGGLG